MSPVRSARCLESARLCFRFIQAARRILLNFNIIKQLLHLFSLHNTTYHIFMRLKIVVFNDLKLTKLATRLAANQRKCSLSRDSEGRADPNKGEHLGKAFASVR